MIITEYLERNARLYGAESALVEINPSDERDQATTWRELNLIASAHPDDPYRREMTWKDFDRRANRFANLLLSRGIKRGTKVAILLMNCLEWLPIYFGVLKAGCIAVPMNFRYSSDEIKYCLDLADAEVLVFGPEFISRMDPIVDSLEDVRTLFFVGRDTPAYAEDCMQLTEYCSSSAPPVLLEDTDDAAIYFSSGTTGFPKAILHNHRALVSSCRTEQHHHSQNRDDVFLCIPPLYHTGAKMHWFGSLLAGAKSVLLRGVKPEWILRAVTEEKCTIVWLLVPWAQDLLDAIESGKIDLDSYYLDQWRLMHIGAQPVPPSLINRWMNITSTTPTTACRNPLAPVVSIWAWIISTRSAPSASPAICGRPRSLTSRATPSSRARSVSWPFSAPASCSATIRTPKPPPKCSMTAGSIPATWPAKTRTVSSIW